MDGYPYQKFALLVLLNCFCEINENMFKFKHHFSFLRFVDLTIVTVMEDPFQNSEKEKELETLVSPIKSQRIPLSDNSGLFELEDSLLVSKPL